MIHVRKRLKCSLKISVLSKMLTEKVRKCAVRPEYLRSEISFLRTCNIPVLISCIYRIALVSLETFH